MKTGSFKVLMRVKKKVRRRTKLVKLEGVFENYDSLMIYKTPTQKLYSIAHINTGGTYVHCLTLKQARRLAKQTKGYTCWKAKSWKELQAKCYSRRWKSKLEKSITKAMETE